MFGRARDPYLSQLVANTFGGQAMNLAYNTAFPWILGYVSNVGGSTGVNLSSAYTFGSAGACAGYRFVSPADDYLTDVYVLATGKTGSPGNLTFEMRNQNNATTPGSTLYVNGSVASVAAFNWIRWTLSTPQAVARNTMYWICVGDAAGSAGNFQAMALRAGPIGQAACAVQGFSTTNGWTSGTISSAVISAQIVLKFASGRVLGNAIMGIGALGSATIQRGFKISGISVPIAVDGMVSYGGWGSNDTARIFAGNTPPTGTPLLDEPAGSSIGTASTPQTVFFKRPFILRPGYTYRAVLNAVSSAKPGGSLGPFAASAYPDILRCAQIGFSPLGTPYLVGTSSSSNAWVDDSVTMYNMGLLVRELRMR